MVIIMNSRPDKEENEKRVGIGNEELLDHFNSYHPVKARNSYDPVGNLDMNVLVLESSAAGYLDAERLHNHLIKQEMGRDALNNPHRKLFCSGGKHQLYDFLAMKEDEEVFVEPGDEELQDEDDQVLKKSLPVCGGTIKVENDDDEVKFLRAVIG
ncbi:hypothetical protein Droror1_Dr00017862 [Drosera rotundifolia]